jgi:hypothetical protein
MTAKLNPVNVRTYNMAEQTKHDYICEGCEKVSKDLECTVYAQVPPYYIRHRCCPFNRKVVTVKKKKRVGQQKQRKR